MPFRASDLQAQEFDEIKFVIPELVPEGVTLLSGSPKIGKSWMLLGMGISVATGGSFLERDCARGNVLYLALEDSPRRLQSRLRVSMGGYDFPTQLHFECEWDRFPVGLRELKKTILENNYSMVMIDTLEMVRPPRRSNPYEDDYRALSGLRSLGSELRCAFVVVHHNRKTQTQTDGTEIDPMERVSGTMGLTGCVDNILVLSRIRDTPIGELWIMGRDIEETCLSVKLDHNLGLWYLHHKGMRVYS